MGSLRRHQRLGLDGRVEVVLVEEGQVEAPGGEALHQFLLLAVAYADLHPRIGLAKAGDQARQVERGDRLEAADVDLPCDHVVIGQGVLLELVGHPQQFLGLAVEARAGGGQRHALGVVADEQLHAEAFLQTLHRRGDRRLGDVQLARGLGHAAAFHGGHEILELPQGIGRHCKTSSAHHPPRAGRARLDCCVRRAASKLQAAAGRRGAGRDDDCPPAR